MKKLQELIKNELILEGLNKAEYKKVLAGIRVGVELEFECTNLEGLAKAVIGVESSQDHPDYSGKFREFLDEDIEWEGSLDSMKAIKDYPETFKFPDLDMDNLDYWNDVASSQLGTISDLSQFLVDNSKDVGNYSGTTEGEAFNQIRERFQDYAKSETSTSFFTKRESALDFFNEQEAVLTFLNKTVRGVLGDFLKSLITFYQEMKEQTQEDQHPYIDERLKYLEDLYKDNWDDTIEGIDSDDYMREYRINTSVLELPDELRDEIKDYYQTDFENWFEEWVGDDYWSDSSLFENAREYLKQSKFYKAFLDAYKEGRIWEDEELGDEEKALRAGLADWKIVSDGSLSRSTGIEIIPPTIPYNRFIELVPDLVKYLEEYFEATSDCGYHISISNDAFDYHKGLKGAYSEYQKKRFRIDGGDAYGYTKFIAYVMALSQGFETTFAFTPERLVSQYAENIYYHMDDSHTENFLEDSVEDILKGKNTYMQSVDITKKFNELNVASNHYRYVEVRLLGDKEGLRVISDKRKLEAFLYEAISRLQENMKIRPFKDIYQTIRTLKRIVQFIEDNGKRELATFARSNFKTRKELMSSSPAEIEARKARKERNRANRLAQQATTKEESEAFDPNTPKERLRELASLGKDSIIFALIENPNTPKDVLLSIFREYANDEKAHFLVGLVNNKNMSEKQIDKLYSIENRKLQLDLIQKGSPENLNKLTDATNEDFPFAEFFSADRDFSSNSEKWGMSSNKNIVEKYFLALTKAVGYEYIPNQVRRGLLPDRLFTPEIQKNIYDSIQDSSPNTLMAFANQTSEEDLRGEAVLTLYKSGQYKDVDYLLGSIGIKLPDEVLKELSTSAKYNYLDTILQSSKSPEKLVIELLENPDIDIDTKVKVLNSPNVPKEAFDILYPSVKSDKALIRSLKKFYMHDDLPDKYIQKVIEDEDLDAISTIVHANKKFLTLDQYLGILGAFGDNSDISKTLMGRNDMPDEVIDLLLDKNKKTMDIDTALALSWKKNISQSSWLKLIDSIEESEVSSTQLRSVMLNLPKDDDVITRALELASQSPYNHLFDAVTEKVVGDFGNIIEPNTYPKAQDYLLDNFPQLFKLFVGRFFHSLQLILAKASEWNKTPEQKETHYKYLMRVAPAKALTLADMPEKYLWSAMADLPAEVMKHPNYSEKVMQDFIEKTDEVDGFFRNLKNMENPLDIDPDSLKLLIDKSSPSRVSQLLQNPYIKVPSSTLEKMVSTPEGSKSVLNVPDRMIRGSWATPEILEKALVSAKGHVAPNRATPLISSMILPNETLLKILDENPDSSVSLFQSNSVSTEIASIIAEKYPEKLGLDTIIERIDVSVKEFIPQILEQGMDTKLLDIRRDLSIEELDTLLSMVSEEFAKDPVRRKRLLRQTNLTKELLDKYKDKIKLYDVDYLRSDPWVSDEDLAKTMDAIVERGTFSSGSMQETPIKNLYDGVDLSEKTKAYLIGIKPLDLDFPEFGISGFTKNLTPRILSSAINKFIRDDVYSLGDPNVVGKKLIEFLRRHDFQKYVNSKDSARLFEYILKQGDTEIDRVLNILLDYGKMSFDDLYTIVKMGYDKLPTKLEAMYPYVPNSIESEAQATKLYELTKDLKTTGSEFLNGVNPLAMTLIRSKYTPKSILSELSKSILQSTDDAVYNSAIQRLYEYITSNPNCPPDVLESAFNLFKNTGATDILNSIAKNPQTPASVIDKLVNLEDSVRYYAAQNPNLPKKYFKVTSIPSFNIMLIMNPSSPPDFIYEYLNYLVDNSMGSPQNTKIYLRSDLSEDTIQLVLSNQSLMTRTFFQNPSLPEDLFHEAFNTYKDQLKNYESTDSFMSFYVRNYPKITKNEYLQILAGSVEYALDGLFNEHAPSWFLDRVWDDPRQDIDKLTDRLEDHPNISPELAQKVITSMTYKAQSKAFNFIKLPAETFISQYGLNYTYRESIASNEYIPISLMKRIIRGGDSYVLRSLILNPSLPKALLVYILKTSKDITNIQIANKTLKIRIRKEQEENDNN